jgi:WD40 repeat protein
MRWSTDGRVVQLMRNRSGSGGFKRGMSRSRLAPTLPAVAVLLAGGAAASGGSRGYVEAVLAGHAQLEAGELAKAKTELEAALALRPENPQCAYALACVAARAGELDVAESWMKKAVEAGFDDAALAGWDPDLDALRKRPKWPELLAALRTRFEARAKFAPELQLDWSFDGMAPQLDPDGTRLLLGRGGRGYLYGLDVDELVAVLSRGGESTVWADFTPDGRFIVRASEEQRFEVWDGSSGRFLHELEGPGYWQGRMQVSADGTRILGHGVTPDSSAAVWEVATGKLVHVLPVGHPTCAALSPDGTRALVVQDAVSADTSVSFWDVDVGKKLAEHRDQGRPMFQAEYSPDGKLAFAMSQERCRVVLFDGVTGKKLRELGPEEPKISFARFLPGTRSIVVQTRSSQLLWIDVDTGEVTHTEQLAKLGWGSLQVDRDGKRLVVAGPHEPWDGGGHVEVRDARTGALLWERDGADERAWYGGPEFRADGAQLASGDGYSAISITDAGTGAVARTLRSPASSLFVAADVAGDTCLLGTEAGALRRVDLRRGTPRTSVHVAGERPEGLETTADGTKLLVTRRDGSAVVLAGDTLARQCELESYTGAHGAWGAGARFGPDGKRIARWARGGEFVTWDAETGKRERTWTFDGADVIDIAWSRDGRYVAAADYEGSAQVWDAKTGAPVGPRIAHKKPVEIVLFDPTSGRLLTGARDATARVFAVGSETPLFELSHGDEDLFGDLSVGCAEYAPDGKSILTATHTFGTVRCWSAEDGGRLWAYAYDGGNPATLHAHFDRSGARIAAFGQGNWTPRIVDAKTGETRIDLQGRGISTLAFPADEKLLLAGMGDSLQVLEASDGRMLYERVELEGGGALLRTASMHVEGPATALRRVQVLCAGAWYPLDSFAAQLLDPKRVRAAAEGVVLAPAIVRIPPEVVLDDPATGAGAIGADGLRCAARAEHEDGMLGFEVEQDGVRLDDALVRAATRIAEDRRSAKLELESAVPAVVERTRLRVTAVSRSGAISRPAFVTFVRPPKPR